MKIDAGLLRRIFQVLITLQLTICPGNLTKILNGSSLIFVSRHITEFQFIADIDLSALHLNKQLSNYVSR